MEESQLQSIWGKWWEPIRKWFYPSWLIYETSIRFYDYARSVHNYVGLQQSYITSHIGEVATEFLAASCSISTFAVCSAFLTVPAGIALFNFFKEESVTNSPLERRIKTYF